LNVIEQDHFWHLGTQDGARTYSCSFHYNHLIGILHFILTENDQNLASYSFITSKLY